MSESPSLNNSGASTQVSLKVLEGYTRDVGRGVARIDSAAMDAIGVATGYIIEIKQGKHGRATVAKVLPLYPADEGKGIICIDGLVRNNAGTSVGQEVIVRKVNVARAERVVLSPVEAIPTVDPRYIANALESVPIAVGDNVMVPYFGGRLTFRVLGIAPHHDGYSSTADNTPCGIVTVKTAVVLVKDSMSAITVSINEYVRQEPVVDPTFAASGAVENKSLAFFLGFRIELACANVTDRIDYQRKLSINAIDNMPSIAQKYIDIAKSEVKNANARIEKEVTDANVPEHESPRMVAALRDNDEIEKILRELKYAIVKKWALADTGGI